MKLSITKDVEAIKNIFFNPVLYPLVSCGFKFDKNTFKVSDEVVYLLAEKDNKTIGLVILKALTPLLVEIHPMVLPQYWGTGLSTEFLEEVKKTLKDSTNWTCAVTSIPKDAKEAQGFAFRMGGHIAGTIKKAVLYKERINDLILFRFEIKD